METTTQTTGMLDNEGNSNEENKKNSAQSSGNEQNEIEKGSGYGPPNQGSGVMVPADNEEKGTEKADRDANSLHMNDE